MVAAKIILDAAAYDVMTRARFEVTTHDFLVVIMNL
jgi:hypothetical protein